MDFTKRKLFLLLLGACGVIFLLLAYSMDFGSTHEVFLVAANFHNSSLSYLTSLNFNLGELSGNNKRLKTSLVNEKFRSDLDELIRNPNFNVTDGSIRSISPHNNSVSRDSNSVSRGNSSVSRDYSSESRANSATVRTDSRGQVGTVPQVTKSEINDRTIIKAIVNNSYLEENVRNIKAKNSLPSSRKQSILDNSFDESNHLEALHQSNINTSHTIKELNRPDHDAVKKLLYRKLRNRLMDETQPPKDITQHNNKTDHVKAGVETDLFHESDLVPNENSIVDVNAEIADNKYDLHNQEEMVKLDKDDHGQDSVKTSSKQQTDDLQNGGQKDPHHREFVRTDETNQNFQNNNGDIPLENSQNHMTNNEQVVNGDAIKTLATQASEGQTENRNLNGERQSSYRGNQRNMNQVLPQNEPQPLENNLVQRRQGNADIGLLENPTSDGTQASEGKSENGNLNRDGPGSYRGNQQDMNQVLPQNNQQPLENNLVQQKHFDADIGHIGKPSSNRTSVRDKDVPHVEQFSVDASCSKEGTSVEDILCMDRPQFLPDFRNPCWYQYGVLRCLPYFQIIGVCKTGTTDLFERLSHHPQVLKNRGILGKETWYWTWRRYGHSNFYRSYTGRMTLDTFIDQFDAQAIESHTKRLPNGTLYHPAVTGHGDPMDFWDQSSWKRIPQNDYTADGPKLTTPSLIKHVNPNIKLILILRDPVERLFSNYLHGQFGSTADEFHHDVIMSRDLLKACTKTRSMRSCLYDENVIRSLRVPISGSFYSIHIKEWLKVFPRKQIFITRTEAFAKNIADTLLGIFRFLKLDPLPTRDLYRVANMPHFYNTKGKETSGSIQQETRDILRPMFEPYNIELARLLKDENFNFNHVR